MKIEGHRPYFDTGPGVAPMGPQQSPPPSSQRVPDTVAKVAKTSGAPPSHARQAGEAAPITEAKQKADREAKATADQGEATAKEASPGDPTYKEPTMPRLNAEALATALMNSEPDKAVVPRVLPQGMVEGE